MAGGVFDAFQRGVETSRQRRFQDEAQIEAAAERAYRDSRRARLDPLQDQLLEHQVGEAGFQADTRGLRMRGLEAGTRGAEANAGLAEFGLLRAPTQAQQQDTAFRTQQEQAGLNMELARSGEARAQARHGVDMTNARRQGQVFELQFDAQKAEAERVKALQEWGKERQGIFQLAQRNPEQAVARLNELYARNVTDGNDDAGIRWDGRQFVVVTPDGSGVQQELGDAMGLLSFADLYLSNPEVFAKSVEGQIAAAKARQQAESQAQREQQREDAKNRRAALDAAASDGRVEDGEVERIQRTLSSPRAPDSAQPQPVYNTPETLASTRKALQALEAGQLPAFQIVASDPTPAKIAAFNGRYGELYGPNLYERLDELATAAEQRGYGAPAPAPAPALAPALAPAPAGVRAVLDTRIPGVGAY